MTSALQAVRHIVDPQRIVELPGEITEPSERNRCDPILVRYAGNSWALRLRDGDHLPLLAELPKERSVRRLPDYLIFSEPLQPGDVALQILVCELKSSAGGANTALPQVQLGKLVAEYLVRVAAHADGLPVPPRVWCCGLIASPEFPASMIAKGRTRPGKVGPPGFHDKLCGMRIYTIPGGGELRIESIYG
jgi:hypothetical protein